MESRNSGKLDFRPANPLTGRLPTLPCFSIAGIAWKQSARLRLDRSTSDRTPLAGSPNGCQVCCHGGSSICNLVGVWDAMRSLPRAPCLKGSSVVGCAAAPPEPLSRMPPLLLLLLGFLLGLLCQGLQLPVLLGLLSQQLQKL